MKKKFLIGWLAVFLLLVLSGCRSQAEVKEEVPEPDKAEKQIFIPETEPETEAEPIDLLPNVQVSGCEGLYNLSAYEAVTNETIVDFTLPDSETALLLCGKQGETVKSLSLHEGKLETVWELPHENDNAGQRYELLCAAPLTVMDTKENTVSVRDGEEVSTYAIPPEFDFWSAVFHDPYAYSYNSTDGYVYRMDLNTGAVTRNMKVPCDCHYLLLRGVAEDGSGLCFSSETFYCEDTISYVISFRTHEVIRAYVGEWKASAMTGNIRTDSFYRGNESDSAGEEAEECFVMEVFQDKKQYRQEIPYGLLFPSETQNADCDALLAENRPVCGEYALFLTLTENENKLLLWDYRSCQPSDTEYEEIPFSFPQNGTDALTEQAQRIKEQYDIDILLNRDGTIYFIDYTAYACEDTEQISGTLDVIEEALSLYPEDYFRQMFEKGLRNLVFLITGELVPLDPSANISNALGLSNNTDQVEWIALDAEYSVGVQDVIHELSHTLDRLLASHDMINEETWNSFNPDDFSYYYAYVDENGEGYDFSGSSAYTFYDEGYYEEGAETVYFVDSYSKTFPTEDRARLMETLLGCEWQREYFQSTHLQNKLQYYFSCIRSFFDTADWPEETSWERILREWKEAPI